MICPRCQFDVPVETEFCPHCKAPLSAEGQAASAEAELLDIGQPAPGSPSSPPIPGQSGDPGVVDLDRPVPRELLKPQSSAPHQIRALKRGVKPYIVGGFCALFLCILSFTNVARDIKAMLGLSRPPAQAPAAPKEAEPLLPPAPAAPAQPSPAATQAPDQEETSETQLPDRPAADWAFEGRVYDMITLKPIRGAQLAFVGGDEEQVFTTDAQGLYRASVPPLDEGYSLVVDHPDYLEGYFDETAPPFSRQSLKRRNEMRSAKPSHGPWAADGSKPVHRDIILFPAVTD